jgi:hypothetical protein
MSEYQQAHGPEEPDGGKTAAKVAVGCGLGCLGLAIVVFVVVYMGMKGIQGKVDELAENATSEPIQFDPPDVPAGEADEIIMAFDRFRNALAKAQPVETYTLSEEEINVLINQHRAFAPIAGKAQVKIIDNQIVSDVSVRPEDFPMKIPFLSRAFAGKYINGTATVDVSIRNGLASMYLRKFRFAEWEVPPEMMKQFEGENLLKDSQSDPDLKEFIDKIEELKIEDNTIYIVPRNASPGAP